MKIKSGICGGRLWDMRPGERARVRAVYSTGSIRRRLLDIGLVEGTAVECVGISPMGDPKAYLIRGAVIAVRRENGEEVTVVPLPPAAAE